jgi:hypothetical protein
MFKTRSLALVLSTLATACLASTAPVQTLTFVSFSAAPTTAAPGDTLHLVLANNSRASIAVNLCSVRLERQDGNAWVPVSDSMSQICQLFLHTLSPGDRDTGAKALGSSLASGTYRLQTNVEVPGQQGMASLTTNSFAVQP